jgi:hypothetical protein
VLDGGRTANPTGSSANGLIAGDSQNGLLDPLNRGSDNRGVVWEDGKMIEVGTLDGGHESLARAVNSAEEMVGLSTTPICEIRSSFAGYRRCRAAQRYRERCQSAKLVLLGTGRLASVLVLLTSRHSISGCLDVSVRYGYNCSATGLFSRHKDRRRHLIRHRRLTHGLHVHAAGGQVEGTQVH